MNDVEHIGKTRWIHVTCIARDPASRRERPRYAHFSIRLTKSGRVNRTDVRRCLRGEWLVPPRYTENGIRLLNPAYVDWPEDVIDTGPPPDVYADQPEFAARVRAAILEHHPDKMTAEEMAWLIAMDRKLGSGTATPEEVNQRAAFLTDVATRPICLDEWE